MGWSMRTNQASPTLSKVKAGRSRAGRSVPIAFKEEIADQGDAAVDRQQQQGPQEARAALQAVVDDVGFRFFGGNHRADVFDEINAAFFAFAAGALAIAAGRALKAQGGVAARAESSYVARVRAAFGAFVCGGGLLLGRGRRGPGNLRGRSRRWFCDGGLDLARFGILHGGGGWIAPGFARVLRQAAAACRLVRIELTAHARILTARGAAREFAEAGCVRGVTLSLGTGSRLPRECAYNAGRLIIPAGSAVLYEAGRR
jgi:hypothetical protein